MTWIKKISEFNGSLKRYVDPSFNASVLTAGTIDPARLPPSAGVVVASGDITSLTIDQQTEVITGTKVILASGAAYYYKGAGSKTSLASYIAETAVVAWDGVTSKPASVTAVGAVTPVANYIAYYTGAASALLTALTSFGRSLIGAADAGAARALLACLPDANANATGHVRVDSKPSVEASALGDGGFFGYAGKNTAGAYVGAYAFSDGSIRIAAAATKALALGSGGAYGGLVLDDSGAAMSSLSGTGTRPIAAESTGKLVIDPRAGVQTAGAIAVAINATTKRMLRVTGPANLQLGNSADCANVTVKVIAAFNGSVAIAGEHQYSESSQDYWYFSAGGRSVTVSNYGSDGHLKAFDLWCDGVHWYFKA